MTYVNPYHLKYFVDAVELGGISASAQRNLVSHPAVSRAITAIEEHYKISLLAHRKKSFAVTLQGYKLAKTARELLTTLEKFENSISDSVDTITGTVSLGMSRSIGQAFLGKTVDAICKKYPEIFLEIKFGTTAELVDKLLQGDLDLAVTIGKQSMPTLKQSILRTGQFVIAQAENRSSSSRTMGKIILTEPKFETELFRKAYFKTFQKSLNPKLVVRSWDMIASLVSQGQGFGLVPDFVLNSDRKLKLVKQDWFQCPYEIFLNQKNGFGKNISQKVVTEEIFDLFRANKW